VDTGKDQAMARAVLPAPVDVPTRMAAPAAGRGATPPSKWRRLILSVIAIVATSVIVSSPLSNQTAPAVGQGITLGLSFVRVAVAQPAEAQLRARCPRPMWYGQPLPGERVAYSPDGFLSWYTFFGEQRAGLPPGSLSVLADITRGTVLKIYEFCRSLTVLELDWKNLGANPEASSVDAKVVTMVGTLGQLLEQSIEVSRAAAANKTKIAEELGKISPLIEAEKRQLRTRGLPDHPPRVNHAINLPGRCYSPPWKDEQWCKTELLYFHLGNKMWVAHILYDQSQTLTNFQNAANAAQISLSAAYSNHTKAADAATAGAADYYYRRAGRDMDALILWIGNFQTAIDELALGGSGQTLVVSPRPMPKFTPEISKGATG